MVIKCKRIIGGKTYNTETATQIEGWTEDHHPDGPGESGVYLYQSRFGAFFLYKFLNGYDESDYEEIEPCTSEQARDWLEEHRSYRPELIESLFGEMPEAGAGEVKYTLRMPESLRDRLAALAKSNKQSLNAWVIRCLEGCATHVQKDESASEVPGEGGPRITQPRGDP